MLGKEKCRILKQIRQRIADENDIPYVTRECGFQGECRGTCPRCESELRYLERQLALRASLGKRVAVAALCAVRLCPAAAHAILASHVSPKPAAQTVLDALGKRPLLTAGLRLGEGSGAVAALPLLDMALAVYHSGETFARRGIEPYKRLS